MAGTAPLRRPHLLEVGSWVGSSGELHDCDSFDPSRGRAVQRRLHTDQRRIRGRSRADQRRIRGRCRAGRAAICCPPCIAAGRQLAHLLELLAGGQLLGEQRRLDAVEQAFEPADQLGLGDAQLGVGRDLAVVERQRQRCAARPAGRATAPRSARRSTARRSRRAARGWRSSSGAARTSSSSCLTIEPIRITLAGSVTVSVCSPSWSRRPAIGRPTSSPRSVTIGLGGGSGGVVGVGHAGSFECIGACRQAGVSRRQRATEHSISADVIEPWRHMSWNGPESAASWKLIGVAGDERDVAEAGLHGRRHDRAEPLLVDHLLAGDDPGDVAVRRAPPRPARPLRRAGRGATGTDLHPTVVHQPGEHLGSRSTMRSPTCTWP